MKRISTPAVVAAFVLAFAVWGGVGPAAAQDRPLVKLRRVPAGLLPEGNASASGIGVILPVVGRLVGSGNTLFTTSLDVSNLATFDTTVVFQFQGQDVRTSEAIVFDGRFENDESGTLMRSFSDVHFDDFIASAEQQGEITSDQLADGVLGSMLILFDGVSTSGLGAARARFFSSQFGGTIGVAVNGHEFTGQETTAVAAAFADTRVAGAAPQGSSVSATPRLYSNIFVANLGKFNASTGQFSPSTDSVTFTAFSNDTGQKIGSPLTVTIATGQTISTSLSALGVPAGAGQVIVLGKATSGQGILLGVGAAIDATTTDPSGYAMSNVPANSTGPVQTGGGDLASELAGNWSGSWTNNTFQTTGPVSAAISVDTTAHTFSATITIGGNVFGGSAPPPFTASGSYSTSTGVSYSGHNGTFGDVTFTITPNGAVSGGATNIPSANVSALSFSGTATATTISINYTITLKAGGTATGVMTLTKH